MFKENKEYKKYFYDKNAIIGFKEDVKKILKRKRMSDEQFEHLTISAIDVFLENYKEEENKIPFLIFDKKFIKPNKRNNYCGLDMKKEKNKEFVKHINEIYLQKESNNNRQELLKLCKELSLFKTPALANKFLKDANNKIIENINKIKNPIEELYENKTKNIELLKTIQTVLAELNEDKDKDKIIVIDKNNYDIILNKVVDKEVMFYKQIYGITIAFLYYLNVNRPPNEINKDLQIELKKSLAKTMNSPYVIDGSIDSAKIVYSVYNKIMKNNFIKQFNNAHLFANYRDVFESEILFAIIKAVRGFNERGSAKFTTYLYHAVNNSLLGMINKAKKQFMHESNNADIFSNKHTKSEQGFEDNVLESEFGDESVRIQESLRAKDILNTIKEIIATELNQVDADWLNYRFFNSDLDSIPSKMETAKYFGYKVTLATSIDNRAKQRLINKLIARGYNKDEIFFF